MKTFILIIIVIVTPGCAAIQEYNPFTPPAPIIACQPGANYDAALCQAVREQRAAAERAAFERQRKSGPVYEKMCRDSWIHC